MFDVIIAAGGHSTRMKSTKNKLLLPLNGRTVLENSILPFLQVEGLNRIIVAVSTALFDEVCNLAKFISPKIVVINGGASRTESVKNALRLVSAETVLIHDGARPFVTADIIKRVLSSAIKNGASVPVIPLEDTIVCITDGFQTLNRDSFACVQTPQGFNTEKLLSAYKKITCDYSDDSTVYNTFVGQVATVEGAKYNRKITTADDLLMPECRVGVGFDTHRLVKGRKLIIGGVKIPYESGLLGHSDADVLTHAVMDAILSALGERDIGMQFPDSDEKYKDISSLILLDKVLEIVSNANLKVHNLSATILAEKPKLKDYIPSMCDIYHKKFNIDYNNIGISATTTEGIGSVGHELAISAIATVSLIKI